MNLAKQGVKVGVVVSTAQTILLDDHLVGGLCKMNAAKEFNLLEFGVSEINLRNIISKTVETYPDPWIVVHEAIQNGLDAIQRSERTEGSIDVTMDLGKQMVTVRDNGTGFLYDLSLLLYGGTDKAPDSPVLGGNIGVGIKTVIFSSNYFELSTVTNGYKWGLKVVDAYKYRELDKLIPQINEPIPSKEVSGTTVCYSFLDNKVSEFVRMLYNDYARKVDDKLAEVPEEKFKIGTEYYFRSYSYVGNANRLMGIDECKPTTITLTIVSDEKSISTEILESELRGILQNNPSLTMSFKNSQWDIIEAIGRTRKGFSKPQPLSYPLPEGGRLAREGPNYIYVQSFIGDDQLKKLLVNPYLHTPIDPAQHSAFLSHCLGIYLIVGSVETLRPYLLEDVRQFICARGIPSDHLIDKPKAVGELGYLANIFCIINLDTKLNYGKQNITNKRLLGYANNFFTDAFRATLRNVATAFAGKTRIAPLPELPDILSRPDIGWPDLSIIKEPVDENEVIGILYELVGKGMLTSIQTWLISSRAQYDGKVIMKLPQDTSFPVPRSNKDFQTLEFKIRVWDLVHDFEAQVKDPLHVDLLIAWEDDYSSGAKLHPDYETVEVKLAPGIEERVPRDVNKCLHARHVGKYIPMLILKEVIAGLSRKN